MEPVTMGLAAGQAIWGAIDAISGGKKLNKLMDEREANLYKTPDEINDIADLSKYLAQGGYDAVTLNYLSNNVRRASSNALSSAERMGGDVNDVSNILDKEIEGFMRIGADNAQMQFKNFGNYIDSIKDVAKHKDAEWQDKTNFLKDKIQSAAQQKAAGMQTLGGAVNTASSAIAMGKQGNMWKDLIANLGKNNGGEGGGDQIRNILSVLSAGPDLGTTGAPNIPGSVPAPQMSSLPSLRGLPNSMTGNYSGNGAIIDALLKLMQ